MNSLVSRIFRDSINGSDMPSALGLVWISLQLFLDFSDGGFLTHEAPALSDI